MSILSKLFHRRPETVQAIQFDGTMTSALAIEKFTEGKFKLCRSAEVRMCHDDMEIAGTGYWVVRSGTRLEVMSPNAFAERYEEEVVPRDSFSLWERIRDQ